MKTWKKISDVRYELFLGDSTIKSPDAVLYVESDGTLNFSYGFNGAHRSHAALSADKVSVAKKDIEKALLDETVKTLELYQNTWKQRIDALLEEAEEQ